LNEALDRQEQMLQETMRELDTLNEEIVTLTTEYNSMLQQLKDLVLNT
jgi:predicted patatin/cPLA2 family phospholipase